VTTTAAQASTNTLEFTSQTSPIAGSLGTKSRRPMTASHWRRAAPTVLDYLEGFGDRLPKDLLEAHEQVVEDLQKAI
jgi:hypothetical protein